MDSVQNVGPTCNCPHHKVVPTLIILIGLTALLGTFNVLSAMAVGVIWPILLIAIGVVKFKSTSCKCCSK